MAMSGLWMLIVFFGIIYALQEGFGSDFFILLGFVGAVAYVQTN